MKMLTRTAALVSLAQTALAFAPLRPRARRLSGGGALEAVGGFGGSATRVDPSVAQLALSYFINDPVIVFIFALHFE